MYCLYHSSKPCPMISNLSSGDHDEWQLQISIKCRTETGKYPSGGGIFSIYLIINDF